MALDINKITPEELDQLKALLGVKSDDTRSPMWKPLRDLRPPQTARGRLNRPHFEWSADEPPEGVTIPLFPRLLWDQNGVERRIEDQDHLKAIDTTGWTMAPPMANAISEADRVEREIAQLSPEDRAFLFTAHKTAKMDRLKDAMLGLSASDVAAIVGKPEAVEPKVKEQKKATA